MTLLKVSNICKGGEAGEVLRNISFSQQKLQKIAIAGETGSGKSTLLKVIAGLVQIDPGGEVWFENESVIGPDDTLVPGHSHIAYLSQHFELPRFLRVEQVLAYANTLSGEEAAALYRLCRIDHLLQRRTDQLSGGERQRVALAKLLIASPSLLLLDEPFSNLDMVHKNILKAVINDVCEKLQVSPILVSHDPGDILSWADIILVMKDGMVIHQGSPLEIYRQPVDEYSAGLFGRYNLITPDEARGLLQLPGIEATGKSILARPEDFKIVENESRAIEGVVRQVMFFGSYYEIEITLAAKTILVRTDFEHVRKGDRVYVSLAPRHLWYL